MNAVADILTTRADGSGATRDVLRAEAFGWLARPVDLLMLLTEHTRTEPGQAQLLGALRELDVTPLRPKAIVYVHVHEAALAGPPGVARVEGLGPHTLGHLGHRASPLVTGEVVWRTGQL